MGLFGFKGAVLVLNGVLLAVYMNYPAPTTISRHLSGWENGAAKSRIINKHKIFYKDEYGTKSSGPVLICFHGFPSSSYDWLKVWPALLDKFSRVIAPDFLGFGFSEKPYDHQYSIMEQADIVEKLLQTLKINEVHILAHDYGDTVAQEVLARYEDRKATNAPGLVIKSVCLLNGGIFPETNFPRPMQKALLVPYLGSVLSRLTNIYAFSRGFGDVFGPETQPTVEEFRDFWALIRKNEGNLIMGKLLQYIPERSANRHRWTGVLQKTEVPVHTIYGPADPVNPPGFVEFFKKTVPKSDVSVLDGHIGHYPQWEDPSGTMVAYFNFLKTLPYHGEKTSTGGEIRRDLKKETGPEVRKEKKPKAETKTQIPINGKKQTTGSSPDHQTIGKSTASAKPKVDEKKTPKANKERKEYTIKGEKPHKRSQRPKMKMKEKQGDSEFIEMDLQRKDKEL